MATFKWMTPENPHDPANEARLSDMLAWMWRHGLRASAHVALVQYDQIAVAEGPAPAVPFVVFDKRGTGRGPEQALTIREWIESGVQDDSNLFVSDYSPLVRYRMAQVAFVEAMQKFGQPLGATPPQYPDPAPAETIGAPGLPSPAPPIPADPVGAETFKGAGTYGVVKGSVGFLNGDPFVNPRGTFMYQERETPFGPVKWWRKVG